MPAVLRRRHLLLRRHRRRAVRSAGAVFRVRADCVRGVRCDGHAHRDDAAAGCRRGSVRRPSFADCTAVAGRLCCQIRLPVRMEERRKEDQNLIRNLAPMKTQARRSKRVWETGVQVVSYYRAHSESLRRRVMVLKGPLAPDTDRHHRRIREKVVDCRTDGCAGRDEKDVGVRSCSCGVAVWLRRKVLLEWLTGTADITHAKSGTLFCVGMARYRSCARARMVLSAAGIVQQQVNGTGQCDECPAHCTRIHDPPLALL